MSVTVERVMPRRRHKMTIEVGADSYKELCAMVEEIALEMSLKGDDDRNTFNVVSGGGWFTTHRVDASATAESYKRELREYMQSRTSRHTPLPEGAEAPPAHAGGSQDHDSRPPTPDSPLPDSPLATPHSPAPEVRP